MYRETCTATGRKSIFFCGLLQRSNVIVNVYKRQPSWTLSSWHGLHFWACLISALGRESTLLHALCNSYKTWCGYQWRGGRLIILSRTEWMEWHHAHINHVFDTIPPIPLQPLPQASPPQLRCQQYPVVAMCHCSWSTGGKQGGERWLFVIMPDLRAKSKMKQESILYTAGWNI